MRFLVLILGVSGLLSFMPPAMANDHQSGDETSEAQGPASEKDCAFPCVGYEISTELQNDGIFAANPSSLTSNRFQPTSTADLFFAPTEYLRFSTSIVTERVIDPGRGQGAFLGGIGTYVGALYAKIDADPVMVRLGKFDTIFSLASEADAGINVTELVSDIDADERNGGEVVLGFEGAGLNHTLAATVFTTDRTFLSESLFNNRGRTLLSDGGAGNTNGLSSISLVLDGCKGTKTAECYMDGAFGYRLGFRYQEQGQPTAEDIAENLKLGDELAYLASVTRSLELNDMTLRLLAETSYIRNFEGRPDDAVVVTGSAALELKPLTYIATYTQQANLIAAGSVKRDHLIDFEVIYASEDDTPFKGANWTLGGAYTFMHGTDNKNTHMVSVRVTFEFGGEIRMGR